MVQRVFLIALYASMSAGCGLLLDFDPPDFPGMSVDGGFADFDASTADSGRNSLDASYDTSDAKNDADDASDGSVLIVDSGRVELDADVYDAADSGRIRPDASDADVDASIPDPCYDETGLCIRFADPDPVLPIIAIMSIMYWTEGGVTVDSGWTSDSCLGGLRHIGTTRTDCHFHADPLPSMHVIYFYPVAEITGPRCTSTACAGFHTAYSFWQDGIPIDSTPGVGPVGLERRPTPHGMIMAVKYVTP